MSGNRDSGIREIFACGIRNPGSGIQFKESGFPVTIGIRNLKRNPDSSLWNPKSTLRNPETKSISDSLTWFKLINNYINK